jgi:hypothetical protein
MPVTYVSADEISTESTGRGVVLGEIEGVNTTGYPEGTTIYVAEGGGWSSSRPSGSSSIVQVLGIVTKTGSGGKGLVLNPGPATLPNLQTGYVWVGNTSNQPVAIATSSLVVSVNTGSFATTASNTFIGNQTITGSVILSSSADIELTVIGNTIVSGNLVVTGSNINLEVDAPALSVGVTNVKTLLDATASGVITSEDIYRTGAGPTGDLSGVRLQTLSGSDTTNDTLLSRVSTGVNRNTSTGIVGSIVNSIITSTWATGSGGGRVAFSSNVIANAQSASSTLTLNAGNAASNFAGGTASLVAGRVNIGTTGATITSTGSLTHQGSIVTSGGITVNNLGITATSASINGELRVNGNSVVSASYTNRGIASVYYSTTDNVTGSYVNNFGQNNDVSVPGLLHVINISSASMATLIATSATNPNTIYFVI